MAVKLTAPLTRFGGWQHLGAVKRPVDTRTTEELYQTINLWAQKNPEVKEFLPHLKEMNPKHLGLVADTIELANRHSMFPTDINMKGQTSAGKTLLGVLLDIFPRASKENPNALDFAQEVINNTDSITSKYFLWQTTGGVLENKNVAEHFKAAKPLVEIFAKETLMPPNPMIYDKQRDFMLLTRSVINEDTDPKRISLVKELVDKIKEKAWFDLGDIVFSKTPVSKMQDNLNSVGEVADMFIENGKYLDAGRFLNKNTNLY